MLPLCDHFTPEFYYSYKGLKVSIYDRMSRENKTRMVEFFGALARACEGWDGHVRCGKGQDISQLDWN